MRDFVPARKGFGAEVPDFYLARYLRGEAAGRIAAGR